MCGIRNTWCKWSESAYWRFINNPMAELEKYVSETEVLCCFDCQWEVFPGSNIYVDLGEGSVAIFDRKDCVDRAKSSYFPKLRVEERIFYFYK